MPRDASTSKDTSTETIGIDDGPFTLTRKPRSSPLTSHNYAPLIAAHLRDAHLINVQVGRVEVDGLDGTDQALRLLSKLPGRPVLLSSVTFGGFNLIDPHLLQTRRKMPVIVVTGSRPSNRRMKRALVHYFPDWRERWNIIRQLGPLRHVRTVPVEPPLYYEPFGISARDAKSLLVKVCFVSRVPEPIRVAGLIARGIELGLDRQTCRRHVMVTDGFSR